MSWAAWSWSAATTATLESPLTIVAFGAVATAILAYYVTVRLYRPQKIFEAKQRIYPAIIASLQEFRRDIPLVQRTMRAFPMPTTIPDVTSLPTEEAGKKVVEALAPRMGFSFHVLQSVSEMDRAGESRARVAELAGDVSNEHALELMYHLYGAFLSATGDAARTITSSIAELTTIERSVFLEQVLNLLFGEAQTILATTVSTGGKAEIDWTKFDGGMSSLQELISKDMGRSARLWRNSPGISITDLKAPPEFQTSAAATVQKGLNDHKG